MKYIKSLLALVLGLFLLAAPALAIQLEPGSGDSFYVQDTADVLSSETEALIVEYNEVLEAQCDSAQLVVVTVSYLDEDTEVASLQLMDDWGVGSASQSNGMLLLLVANERRGWLSTGDGIDKEFTDAVSEKYLAEYFWDYIDSGRYDEGVQSLATALYNWYLDAYAVSGAGNSALAPAQNTAPAESQPYENDRNFFQRSGGNSMNIITIIIILVIIWALVSSNRYRRMRGWGYTGGFWPLFWFGGSRMYRDWYHRYPGPRPPHGPRGPHGPGPGGGHPGGMGGPRGGGMRSHGPGGGRPGGMGGPGGGRPGGMGGHGGGRPGGMGGHGGPHGGGMGGHGGGGGGGRH